MLSGDLGGMLSGEGDTYYNFFSGLLASFHSSNGIRNLIDFTHCT